MNSRNDIDNKKNGVDKTSLVLMFLPLVGMIIGMIFFVYAKQRPNPAPTSTPTMFIPPPPIIITVLVPYEITSTPISTPTETQSAHPTIIFPLELVSPTPTFLPTVGLKVLPTATSTSTLGGVILPTPSP